MSNVFNTVKVATPKKNVFDLSHDNKLSTNMGLLTPILVQEVLPGDKWSINVSSLLRFAPMIAPVMHRVQVFTHYYFVPNRIVWANWENFITSGLDGQQSPAFPFINFRNNSTARSVELSSLPDYMGIPHLPFELTPDPERSVNVNAIPFASYYKIINEYFADQNLNDQLQCDLGDGDNTGMYTGNTSQMSAEFGQDTKGLWRRAWRHDYFTACLPFAQKGPSVILPLGDTAPITWVSNEPDRWKKGSGEDSDPLDVSLELGTGSTNMRTSNSQITNVDNSRNLVVDLSDATASTINELRRAYALQRWLEKNAYGGTRYVELLKVHFGVDSDDARLQRPEFLGGTRSNVIVSEVLQQSQSDVTPQGNISGQATAVGDGFVTTRYFKEHGFIIGLMSVMPEPAYQQGLHRQWSKFDRFDYFWHEFAHIGEQAVLNKEIYLQGDGSQEGDEGTFGYIPRYSEYKYIPSRVHGDFKETLDFWHLGRKFENAPQLNAQFIACDPGKHIFAVQNLPDSGSDPDQPVRDWDTLYVHIWHAIKAVRPIPYYSVPI